MNAIQSAGLRRIAVEMLVFDAAALQRQQHEIALLPIDALAVDHRIALAVDHVDHEAALVAVLAGLRADLVR